jgi:hypothetical protein
MTPQNQKVNRRDFIVKSVLAGSGLALGANTLCAAGSSDFNPPSRKASADAKVRF